MLYINSKETITLTRQGGLMSYYDELAAAGYYDVTGRRVHSPQPVGAPVILQDAIGAPACAYDRGTTYRSGRLRSIILLDGTVLIAGLHGKAGELDRATAEKLAPNGSSVFQLLPSLARGMLIIPESELAACRPLAAPPAVTPPAEDPTSLDFYLARAKPVRPITPAYMVDESRIEPRPTVSPIKLPPRRVNTRKPGKVASPRGGE